MVTRLLYRLSSNLRPVAGPSNVAADDSAENDAKRSQNDERLVLEQEIPFPNLENSTVLNSTEPYENETLEVFLFCPTRPHEQAVPPIEPRVSVPLPVRPVVGNVFLYLSKFCHNATGTGDCGERR